MHSCSLPASTETDRSISGAVMVEIEKPGNEDLGISLAPCHEVKTGQNAFFISQIRQGSIGDRLALACMRTIYKSMKLIMVHAKTDRFGCLNT